MSGIVYSFLTSTIEVVACGKYDVKVVPVNTSIARVSVYRERERVELKDSSLRMCLGAGEANEPLCNEWYVTYNDSCTIFDGSKRLLSIVPQRNGVYRVQAQ